jgi:hypothetical protein
MLLPKLFYHQWTELEAIHQFLLVNGPFGRPHDLAHGRLIFQSRGVTDSSLAYAAPVVGTLFCFGSPIHDAPPTSTVLMRQASRAC